LKKTLFGLKDMSIAAHVEVSSLHAVSSKKISCTARAHALTSYKGVERS
jgi:hypothetical protein